MITYNDISEARKREKADELQLLPNNFIEEVANYFKEKREFSLKEDDEFSDVIIKTKKQLENAKTIFKELMRVRKKKILNMVLIATETGVSKKDFDNMFDFEKDLFGELMEKIEKNDKNLSDVINGKVIRTEKPEEKIQKVQGVTFKEDVEEFVDLKGNMLGPFKVGDEKELPKEIVNILVEDGKVELVQ